MNERVKRQKELAGRVKAVVQKRRRANLLGDDPDSIADVPEAAPGKLDMGEVESGVSLNFLHHVFHMDRNTAKMKLAGCPPLRIGAGGQKIYSFSQAAEYLVTPRFDLERALRSMKPADLPANLRPAVWDAKLKQQKWEEKARDLWQTADVLDVLTETFKLMRMTMQVWVESLERTNLTEEQRNIVNTKVDELALQMRNMLHMNAAKKRTRALIQDVDNFDGIKVADE